MIVAIIAGGAGTRLWPLSTPGYPKHLLKVINDQRSLLQLAYDRSKKLTNDIFVVTEIGHAHLIKQQLPDLPDSAFIVEPARRNTAGCFLAVLHAAQKRKDHDEPIAIVWADHYIRNMEGFTEAFKIAGKATKKYGLPVLVGVEPTYPAVVFGYIHKAGLMPGEQRVYKTAGFKEKPQLKMAQQFFDSGQYLWNCGYMVGTLNAFEAAMRADCPGLWADYQTLLATKTEAQYKKAYLALEGVQLDYVFNELVKNMLTVPGIFNWVDVGSFNDLHSATDRDDNENSILGDKIAIDEVENSYIRNDEDKPLAVIGLDNIVIVNTPAGILVARKDLAPRVRDVIKKFDA